MYLGALAVLVLAGSLWMTATHSRYQRETRTQMHILLAEQRGAVEATTATYGDLVAYVTAVERRLAALEARADSVRPVV